MLFIEEKKHLASPPQLNFHLYAVDFLMLSKPFQDCGNQAFSRVDQQTNERRGSPIQGSPRVSWALTARITLAAGFESTVGMEEPLVAHTWAGSDCPL